MATGSAPPPEKKRGRPYKEVTERRREELAQESRVAAGFPRYLPTPEVSLLPRSPISEGYSVQRVRTVPQQGPKRAVRVVAAATVVGAASEADQEAGARAGLSDLDDTAGGGGGGGGGWDSPSSDDEGQHRQAGDSAVPVSVSGGSYRGPGRSSKRQAFVETLKADAAQALEDHLVACAMQLMHCGEPGCAGIPVISCPACSTCLGWCEACDYMRHVPSQLLHRRTRLDTGIVVPLEPVYRGG